MNLPPPTDATLRLPTDPALRVASRAENFPVLSFLVPRALRPDFAAVYAFCRAADDLGDEHDGSAPARRDAADNLDRFRALMLEPAGDPPPALRLALDRAIARHRLPLRPFHDLIDAFIDDQRHPRRRTFDELLAYSRKSANPVGRLVLIMLGHRPPDEHPANAELFARSDDLCTALQLANFWQDVRRDLLERDRVYLPSLDTGLTVDWLLDHLDRPSRVARRTYAHALRPLVDRTAGLFDRGRAITALLPPPHARLIRAFSLAGEALVQRLRDVGYATLWTRPRITGLRKAWILARAAAGR